MELMVKPPNCALPPLLVIDHVVAALKDPDRVFLFNAVLPTPAPEVPSVSMPVSGFKLNTILVPSSPNMPVGVINQPVLGPLATSTSLLKLFICVQVFAVFFKGTVVPLTDRVPGMIVLPE